MLRVNEALILIIVLRLESSASLAQALNDGDDAGALPPF